MSWTAYRNTAKPKITDNDMKRTTYIIIALAICIATSCSTKSDYEIEREEFVAEQAELVKERQELAEEEAELRKEYEELRQEYLREKKEFQKTVAKEKKSYHKKPHQLTSSEIDTLTSKVRSSALWPTSDTK